MNWTELLNCEIEGTYGAVEGLLNLVDDDALGWKPPTGQNWMTLGQLIFHCTNACGLCCKGFVTGDWGIPGGGDLSEMAPDDMLPPAEKMPAAESVEQIRGMLAADKQVALDMVRQAGEQRLAEQLVAAPWAPTPQPLGVQLLHMVGHLGHHKAQLYYYLKLQGKPVNTGHLYGMSM